jgi:hypothetical protein
MAQMPADHLISVTSHRPNHILQRSMGITYRINRAASVLDQDSHR